jgi:hypothetical protein
MTPVSSLSKTRKPPSVTKAWTKGDVGKTPEKTI